MFCPNCGAQNPDNATACSNCGFNLSKQGTAAPKFKGTMLMMNSPLVGGAPEGPTPGQAPNPSPLTDPNDPTGRRQMKGTIVGIAPPAPGAAPAPIHGLVPPPSADPAGVPSGGSFSPPGSAGAVNPMGSTFVADDKPIVGFPPPTPGYGGGAAYGAAPAVAPPPAPGAAAPLDVPAYNPPAPDYGAPPAGGYSPPPPQPNYGPPPGSAAGYGAPVQSPGAMMAPPFGLPTDAGAMVPVSGQPMMGSGAVGTIRNPVGVVVLTMCTFGLYGLYTLYSIENELHAFLGDGKKASILWFLFPLLPLLALPKVVAQARAKAGTPAQGEGNLILYLLLGPYMIPTDTNQIWQHLGAQPPA